ncbi:MAG: hypothetical protein OEM59_07720 [Rhodospirillales bacterium]|nr:hypothetical protein [Rhodospirillales bacterium]
MPKIIRHGLRLLRWSLIFSAAVVGFMVGVPLGVQAWTGKGHSGDALVLPPPAGYCRVAWHDWRQVMGLWIDTFSQLSAKSELLEWFVACDTASEGEGEGVVSGFGLDAIAAYYDLGENEALRRATREDFVRRIGATSMRPGLPGPQEAAEVLAAGAATVRLRIDQQDDELAGYTASMAAALSPVHAVEGGRPGLKVNGFTKVGERPVMLMIQAPYTQETSLDRLLQVQREALRGLIEAN